MIKTHTTQSRAHENCIYIHNVFHSSVSQPHMHYKILATNAARQYSSSSFTQLHYPIR